MLFGGTAEGRALAELLERRGADALVCVATEYGQALLPPMRALRVQAGRLDEEELARMLERERPRAVIDATHPYAAAVSENLQRACRRTGTRLLRLLRESVEGEGAQRFAGLAALLAWADDRPGVIFSTLGAKEAPALAALRGFRERVWLRILPDPGGLSACLAAGFPPGRIICMQGPFSQELNEAMFRAAGAALLLTKESGAAGGYPEKLAAARVCGMTAAVLARPRQEAGMTLAELTRLIEEGGL